MPKRANRILIRNFVVFFIILVLCAGSLSIGLISGEKDIEEIDKRVSHTYDVINEAQELSTLIESMLSQQRGHLITKNDLFLERYTKTKAKVEKHIERLTKLTKDNTSQTKRLETIRELFDTFSQKLDTVTYIDEFDQGDLEDTIEISRLKEKIIRTNVLVLLEEYDLLNQRISALDQKKKQYFYTLLTGIFFGTLLLLILNSYLLRAQGQRTRAEANLKKTEERLKLAFEGTQDGIFDWNIVDNEVFYSKRYLNLLGYKKAAFTGTTDFFKSHLHPDEEDDVLTEIRSRLSGNEKDYAQEFRMKHKDGYWIWIQARATIRYNDKLEPQRMVGAHTDITMMKAQQDLLEQEKFAAEKANMAKTDFLAHMSHEIRTPLTAISGIAEIFSNNTKGLNPRQAKLVQTLSTSTASLKDLINDILDFSKIESGELDLDMRIINLEDLFNPISDMMSIRVDQKGLDFTFTSDGLEANYFYGDETRIRQILVNLIGNAIKFTEEGEIQVNAYTDLTKNQLCIAVKDTGIGIPEDDIEIIFDRFKQGDTSVSRKYGGTGLGLPISRNLAALMNGEITVESKVGKGSLFTLKLPVTAIEDAPPVQKSKVVIEKLSETIQRQINKNDRVLLAEDYEGTIEIISYMLETMGLPYDIAKTGEEAVKFFKKHHYTFIIMDIQMPGLDGIEATKIIRALEKDKEQSQTPILGLTAHAFIEDKNKCLIAGMNSCLSKPINEIELKKEIITMMNINENKQDT